MNTDRSYYHTHEDMTAGERRLEILREELSKAEEFRDSEIGKAMRKFCDEYVSTGTYDKADVDRILSMPEAEKYGIHLSEEGNGETFGRYKETFYVDYFKLNGSWFMFYRFNNFDLDKDIAVHKENIERESKEVGEITAEVHWLETPEGKYCKELWEMCELCIPDHDDYYGMPESYKDADELADELIAELRWNIGRITTIKKCSEFNRKMSEIV